MADPATSSQQPARPPAHIIALSDGTGNSSAALFRTNVWKLYQALDLEDPAQGREPRQFALYNNGVGTSSFKPLAVLGGMFGIGLARNVRSLYAFISRSYRPGDKIYVFGFSRGAFTVRILLGLIRWEGLAPYNGNDAQFGADVAAAYRAYRARRFHTVLRVEWVFRQLRDLVVYLRNTAFRLEHYSRFNKRSRADAPARDEIAIEFVGVWDTVAAYGLPVDELTRAIDRFFWPMVLPDRSLGRIVKRAMHALSLDDERQTFVPELWTEGPSGDPRIAQVWFAGVHSDVGGGYPDDSVSYVPLEWVMTGSAAAGLRFREAVHDQYKALSDENGPINDSRRGLAGYYRYNPRRIERLLEMQKIETPRVKVHESVLRRVKAGQDGYAPIVLPDDFDVVRVDGSTLGVDEYLGEGLWAKARDAREHVFNFVWARRLVYFLTLGLTLCLTAMPMFWPATLDGACQSTLCVISPIFTPLKALLPGFTAVWLDSFASHPDVFLLFVVPTMGGLWLGGSIAGAISGAMRAVWYEIPKTKPRDPSTFVHSRKAEGFTRGLQSVRGSAEYKKAFFGLTHHLLPFCFFLIVATLGAMVGAKAWFSLTDADGDRCTASPNPQDPLLNGRPPRVVTMATSAPCTSTGYVLKKRGSYRLTFALPPDRPWFDDGIPSGPYGNDPNARGAEKIAAFVPLRRHWSETWFKPMAKIGGEGTDTYALTPRPSVAYATSSPPQLVENDRAYVCPQTGGPAPTFTTEIIARSEGELFLYVNDAILFPPWTFYFYENNHGVACVTVEALTPELQRPGSSGEKSALSLTRAPFPQ